MSAPGVVFAGFEPVVLQRPVQQATLLSYTAWLMAMARCASARSKSARQTNEIVEQVRAAVGRFGVDPEYISARQFNAFPEKDDELGLDGNEPVLPPAFADLLSNPGGPTLDRRMQDFQRLAGRVFERWYEERPRPPEHLLHVSCSGYASPSPAQRWLSQHGWLETTVTHCYHMGCYGAFPALRTAAGLVASAPAATAPEARVDIVHTEYLSNHFDPLLTDPGHIIDVTLFADGFIGYSAYPERGFAELGLAGVRLLGQAEALIPGTLGEMTWTLGPRQFDMHLSKAVPLAIREALPAFVRRLCARAGVDLAQDRAEMLFAIHPGGPKILDHARDALELREEQVRHARQVFHELGNMSSATIPFVLKRILDDATVPPGTRGVAVAFGPGLTATGMVFEKIAGPPL